MRLIDADALIELIESGFDLQFDKITEKALVRMIREQDTAFDVEKVVVELEKQITTYPSAVDWAYRKAIDIVKKGGVE